ncbi:tetratricopeptide repeat protein [Sinorhizobium fredii]|uniref:Tetratricopeptide repeat-containing protein n=1 Tax=Rhizobium fredii TaxID=380 RepID=A0A2L0HCR9_RHIFR|nr:hypothetical protein [Sinorhizobium fredii]AUX79298.1 tetratricopeptide repeat-containing protein [Sinorhizobium fredii]
MDAPITLEIVGEDGIFRHGDAPSPIVDELDAALDRRESGSLTEVRYLSALRGIVQRQPQFIDGHAHLGYALLEQGKPKAALDACLQGLQLGENAIPASFAGRIEWGFLENRPFLRAAHGAMLCRLKLGQRKEALTLMEKMLAWNPNDNQGIRFLIGSEYLRAGKTTKASRVFIEEADQYPPYHYELGLLHFQAGNPVAAATSLRPGFVANGYVAEILSGNPDPMPLAIWHSSNLAEPEVAHDYVEQCGDLWRKTEGAIPFLRWLHVHPKVMAERAAVFDWLEALLWEHDVNRRGMLLDREEAALAAIDGRLSAEIVVQRTDRHGRSGPPWLYPQTRSWL